MFDQARALAGGAPALLTAIAAAQQAAAAPPAPPALAQPADAAAPEPAETAEQWRQAHERAAAAGGGASAAAAWQHACQLLVAGRGAPSAAAAAAAVLATHGVAPVEAHFDTYRCAGVMARGQGCVGGVCRASAADHRTSVPVTERLCTPTHPPPCDFAGPWRCSCLPAVSRTGTCRQSCTSGGSGHTGSRPEAGAQNAGHHHSPHQTPPPLPILAPCSAHPSLLHPPLPESTAHSPRPAPCQSCRPLRPDPGACPLQGRPVLPDVPDGGRRGSCPAASQG